MNAGEAVVAGIKAWPARPEESSPTRWDLTGASSCRGGDDIYPADGQGWSNACKAYRTGGEVVYAYLRCWQNGAAACEEERFGIL